MDLNGKVIVISGGSGGIGVGTCMELMKYNLSALAILDMVENPVVIAELKSKNSSIKILFTKTDVTNRENVEKSFDKIIKEFHKIDIVICNAGRAGDQEVELTMKVNFLGVVYMTLTAMSLMSKSNGGVIMATSSVAGLGSSFFCLPIYSASKHAVIGFYRSLSNQFYFNKHNIKFLLMCPGQTQTPIIEGLEPKVFDPDLLDLATEVLQSIPMQSSETMGKLMVDALKIGENGSVWIGDDGKLSQVELKEYWP